MKKVLAFILVCFCFAFSFSDNPFKQLQTLAGGTWVMETKTGFICEKWTRTGDKELSGRGFKIAGIDTTLEEKVQLIENGSGIFYIPTVGDQNGGKAVPFKLTEVKGYQFIFSNPDHDYPQIVAYDFVSTDSLHAWIDGKIHGKQRKIDYYYRRTK